MAYRLVNVNRIKSKRKKNQYINELINIHSTNLLISKKEFKLRHKNEIENLFKKFGWNSSTDMYINDCLGSAYWYKDPICYKTNLDNVNYLDFNEKFISIFGEEILKNKKFLKQMKALNNSYLNSKRRCKN